MNTRQKKKQFKKIHGENPPKWMELCEERLQICAPKLIRQQETGNLKVFIKAMTEGRRCGKRNRKKH